METGSLAYLLRANRVCLPILIPFRIWQMYLYSFLYMYLPNCFFIAVITLGSTTTSSSLIHIPITQSETFAPQNSLKCSLLTLNLCPLISDSPLYPSPWWILTWNIHSGHQTCPPVSHKDLIGCWWNPFFHHYSLLIFLQKRHFMSSFLSVKTS